MERCPRCHEAIRAGSQWTPLEAGHRRGQVLQVRHRKGDGRICIAYLGPRLGVAQPQRQAAGFGAPLLAAAEALARR